METSTNEGVIVYTNEQRGFEYTEGPYKLTGNKVSANGEIQSIDGGNAQKDGAFVGSFYVRFDDGKARISFMNVETSEVVAVYTTITNLLAKFEEERN